MKQLSYLIIILCACAGCTGASQNEEHGTLSAAFPSIKAAGPMHSSKTMIIESTVTNGETELTVPLDTPEDSMLVLLGESNATMKNAVQKQVTGTSFDEPELSAMNLPSMGIQYKLGKYKSGKQKMKLSGITREKTKVIVAQPNSTLSLGLQITPLAARAGEQITVEARISDTKLPSDAVLTASYDGGSTLALSDDGIDPDKTAGDGIFTGSCTAPKTNGFTQLMFRVKAAGTRSNGAPFERDCAAAIMLNASQATICQNDVTADQDEIVIPLTVSGSINARVEVIYGSGSSSIAWSGKTALLSDGSNEVCISRLEESLPADRAVIRVLNCATKGLEDEVEISLTQLKQQESLEANKSKTESVNSQSVLPTGKAKAAANFEN